MDTKNVFNLLTYGNNREVLKEIVVDDYKRDYFSVQGNSVMRDGVREPVCLLTIGNKDNSWLDLWLIGESYVKAYDGKMSGNEQDYEDIKMILEEFEKRCGEA